MHAQFDSRAHRMKSKFEKGTSDIHVLIMLAICHTSGYTHYAGNYVGISGTDLATADNCD